MWVLLHLRDIMKHKHLVAVMQQSPPQGVRMADASHKVSQGKGSFHPSCAHVPPSLLKCKGLSPATGRPGPRAWHWHLAKPLPQFMYQE